MTGVGGEASALTPGGGFLPLSPEREHQVSVLR